MAELESKVDRCLRRCDSDLERFGNEIELEQPGIREKLDEDAMNLEPRDKNHSEATDEDDYQVGFIYRSTQNDMFFSQHRFVAKIFHIIEIDAHQRM